MEQKHVSSGLACDRLPTMSVKDPWLVAQNLEADNKDQIFYTMHDPMSTYDYQCQIPELVERRIRGCFHGWVILSNHQQNIMWSLWNPVTSKTILLPPLTLKDGDFESISYCCLSSPPDDVTSVLMLTRTKTPTIVFCQIDSKRKRLRWKEMTYAKQFKSITGYNGFLHNLTCCNGKVYALISEKSILIQIDIVVKDKEVVISLLAAGELPFPLYYGSNIMKHFLKGYCRELFYIKIGYDEMAKKTIGGVYIFKLDWGSMIWEEMEDLKDAVFFADLAPYYSVVYRHSIASDLGGFVHFLGDMGKIIYSYNVKDRTISLSSLSCLGQATHVSLWEYRLQCDHVAIKCGTCFKPEDDNKDEIVVRSVGDGDVNEENYKPSLLSVPLDVLKMIMELCVGVEYLNFRATCKQCQLAAPMIRWSSETSLRRLQQYSVVSPWLIVLDNHRGIITFTDPMFGEKYYMKTPQKLIGVLHIYCSKYGWLLLFNFKQPGGEVLFFNPFTNDIREVPGMPFFVKAYVSLHHQLPLTVLWLDCQHHCHGMFSSTS